MKMRSVLLMLVSMLLIGGSVGAAMAAGTPAAPAVSAPAAVVPASLAPSPCGLNFSKLTLPPVTSPVVNKSAGETCGACSTPVCRGIAWGSGGCSLRDPRATCIDALATTCNDGTPQCQCWDGPLP